jgi:hypothetical protein
LTQTEIWRLICWESHQILLIRAHPYRSGRMHGMHRSLMRQCLMCMSSAPLFVPIYLTDLIATVWTRIL